MTTTDSRHGTMPTDRPERYAKQLAGHWARKGSAGPEGDATVIRFDSGNVVTLRPAEGILDIIVEVPEGGDADRFSQVVAEHLQRFAARDGLQVSWD
jgi:hypothetical protein